MCGLFLGCYFLFCGVFLLGCSSVPKVYPCPNGHSVSLEKIKRTFGLLILARSAGQSFLTWRRRRKEVAAILLVIGHATQGIVSGYMVIGHATQGIVSGYMVTGQPGFIHITTVTSAKAYYLTTSMRLFILPNHQGWFLMVWFATYPQFGR